MPTRPLAAIPGRAWFSILVLVSAALVIVTFFSFAAAGSGWRSRILFWIGLAGENNVGAWWSGMMLLLASALAFDGFAAARSRSVEGRGWLALAAVLLTLSFDEVASLHEYLANSGLAYLGALAALLFTLTGYAFLQLFRSGIARRVPLQLLLAFTLLATVPLQEYVQHSREWLDPVVYGLRAAVEEGIELTAILLLVATASRNTRALLAAQPRDAFAFARHPRAVLAGAAALAPFLVAATFALPYPGGPADWLAAACYFACALLVVRQVLRSAHAATGPVCALFAWYVAASLCANAIRLEWDPALLGMPISLREMLLVLLLVTAVPILRIAGRPANPRIFLLAALGVIAASPWPHAQVLWCGLPVLVALYVYAIESRLAPDDSIGAVEPGEMIAAADAAAPTRAQTRVSW